MKNRYVYIESVESVEDGRESSFGYSKETERQNINKLMMGSTVV